MGKNTSKDLDATDAHFVDILHTGAGILGQWGPNGHADFYINGGSSQPGCGSETIFSKFKQSLKPPEGWFYFDLQKPWHVTTQKSLPTLSSQSYPRKVSGPIHVRLWSASCWIGARRMSRIMFWWGSMYHISKWKKFISNDKFWVHF